MRESDVDQLQYRPGHFNHCPPALERALWEFLRRPDNIVRVETATSLDRAAVEALSSALVAEYGVEISAREVKQAIGHMVRQVMEALGYEGGPRNENHSALSFHSRSPVPAYRCIAGPIDWHLEATQ